MADNSTTVKVDSDGVPYWDMLPGTRLDFTVNWSTFLSSVSDTIASTFWSATPSGLTISSATTSGSKATIWAQPSIGNANTNYVLTSKIFTPTPNNRREKQKLRLKIGS